MLVARSLHPEWLSNTYVVGDEPGGTAIFVDAGGPLEPLVSFVDREELTPTHLLVTHYHGDHVALVDDLVDLFGIEVTQGPVLTGRLAVEAMPTPGHSEDGVSFVVNAQLCFSGDTLFKDAVGGGPALPVEHSVMKVLMGLAPETRVLPGHTDETTIGREWEENPFVRWWRGLAEPDGRRCRLGGQEGEVLVWSPDYDGKGKLLVRFDDGSERIAGASRVELL